MSEGPVKVEPRYCKRMARLAQPGDVIMGRYTILRPLGVGSMAEVFAAYDAKREREVALKLIRRNLARDPETIRRLEREAKVQRMIRHRNVAKLYEIGRAHV